MTKQGLTFKYSLLTAGFVFVFVLLGTHFTDWLVKKQETQIPNDNLHPIFFAKFIDRLNSQDKIAGLRELENLQVGMPTPEIHLVDDSGQTIYPESALIEPVIDSDHLNALKKPYDILFLKKSIPNSGATRNYDQVAQPLPPPHLMQDPLAFGHRPPSGLLAPPPRAPPPLNKIEDTFLLVKLNVTPNIFMSIAPPKTAPKNLEVAKYLNWIPWLGALFLALSLFIGIGSAHLFILKSWNRDIATADKVLRELEEGNLKARFPLDNKNEFQQAMLRFNRMADEIEKLVIQLKKTETSRTELLQDLAHDLRTPIASMKSFIEILHEKFNTLDEKNRNEILSITLKEIEFFSRMVNDLLFLAQVNEPKYKDRNDDVDLVYLISEECYELEFRESQREKSVKIKTVFPTNPSLIHGDRHLLQRLFRNALENAISFARTEVLVCIEVRDPQLAESDSAEHSINNKPPAKTEVSNKLIRISIEDDGPGFSAEALSRFGIKRFQRNTQTDQHSKRISVGLGSVIMASICQIHNGRLSVQNRIDSTEKIMGSKIQIEFGPGFIEPT